MQRPPLRDNKGKRQFELYPLGHIPSHMIWEMEKWLTYPINDMEKSYEKIT